MLNGALLIVVVFSVLQAVGHSTQPARRVAITIDDGPVVGEMTDLAAFQRVSNGLIASLTADKVPATIFVNERQLNVPGQRDARAAVLEQWLDAGFDLANHTYSHPSLNKVPLWQFGDEVVKGEVMTEEVPTRITWWEVAARNRFARFPAPRRVAALHGRRSSGTAAAPDVEEVPSTPGHRRSSRC